VNIYSKKLALPRDAAKRIGNLTEGLAASKVCGDWALKQLHDTTIKTGFERLFYSHGSGYYQ
jgi:hypothetical protein